MEGGEGGRGRRVKAPPAIHPPLERSRAERNGGRLFSRGRMGGTAEREVVIDHPHRFSSTLSTDMRTSPPSIPLPPTRLPSARLFPTPLLTRRNQTYPSPITPCLLLAPGWTF